MNRNIRMFLLRAFLQQQAGNDGGDGGSGGGEPQAPKTYSEEDIAGLKAKNGEVIGENKTLKQQLADSQTFAKQFEGLDVESLKALASKAKSDEEAALLAKGEVEEVVSRRLAARNADFEKVTATKDGEIEQLRKQVEVFKQGAVSAELAKQAVAVGILPEAIDGLFKRFGTQFTVDDKGQVVAADGVLGKDGVTPLTAAELFTQLRETESYLFGKPQGGEAGGSSSKTNKSGRDSMSSQEKATYIKTHGQDAYLKLPK